jgi:hypothetical protein
MHRDIFSRAAAQEYSPQRTPWVPWELTSHEKATEMKQVPKWSPQTSNLHPNTIITLDATALSLYFKAFRRHKTSDS